MPSTATLLFLGFLLCLSLTEQVPVFSDNFARTFLWPLQVLTYGAVDDSETANCFEKKFPEWKWIGGHSELCTTMDQEYSNQTCQYVLVRSDREKTVIMTFAVLPASNGNNDLTDNILDENSATINDFCGLNIGLQNAYAVSIARQFMFGKWGSLVIDAFGCILIPWICRDDYAMWYVGHGTGAVLADLTGMYYVRVNNISNEVHLTTFGSPRPGDAVYADNREARLAGSHRITQPNDQLLGRPGGNFTHHLTEIFYPKGSNEKDYEACSGREDKACSAGQKGDSSFNSNSRYFGLSIHDSEAFCAPRNIP